MAGIEDVDLDIEDLKAIELLDRDAKEWQRDVEVDRKLTSYPLTLPSH
jgi:hypothetical protein